MSKNAHTDPRIDWDDLLFFLTLAKEGTLSSVGKKMSIEHTTVSRRISRLESKLGIKLFDRLPRAWRLTAEGESLLPQAEQVQETVLRFERAASGRSHLSGTVRVSAPPLLSSFLLAGKLEAFHRKHPLIELELSSDIGEANLSKRDADVAIRMTRPKGNSLVRRSLGLLHYGVYGSSKYLDGKSTSQWRFLGYDESLSDVPQEQWLKEFRADRPVVFRTNDLAALHGAVCGHLGLALLPRFLADKSPGLKLVHSDAARYYREMWLVTHQDIRRSIKVQAVSDYLVSLFEKTL